MAWPPPDADALLERWRDLDRPEIPLTTAVTIRNLERWFYPIVAHEPPVAQVQRVRQELARLKLERMGGGHDDQPEHEPHQATLFP